MKRHLPLAGVTLLALALRLWRAGLRWDEIALAYAAYQQPWVDTATGLDLRGTIGTFVGLHPPAYSLLFALTEWTWGAPAAWLLLSALLSTAAVGLLGWRFGPWAALALALDPFQLAYAAEVNNYPLVCMVAAGLLATRRIAHRGGPWWPLALVAAVAPWTHALTGALAGACVLSLFRTRSWQAPAILLGLMVISAAPLVVGVSPLMEEGGTFSQPDLDWVLLWEGLWVKGGWALATWPLALLAFPKAKVEVLLLVGMGAVILGMMWMGVAAVHQQPYWVVLGPLVAVALSRLHWAGPVLGAVLGAWVVLPGELQRTQGLRQDLERSRAIDVALQSTVPGDALWLLSPAWQPDDDKTATSDVLWRFSPWRPAPIWRDGFPYDDYRWGQPRWLGERLVHSSTDLDPETVAQAVSLHQGQGRALWFVLYDHGYANDYPGMMQGVLEPFDPQCIQVGADVGMGRDWLCQVLER